MGEIPKYLEIKQHHLDNTWVNEEIPEEFFFLVFLTKWK